MLYKVCTPSVYRINIDMRPELAVPRAKVKLGQTGINAVSPTPTRQPASHRVTSLQRRSGDHPGQVVQPRPSANLVRQTPRFARVYRHISAAYATPVDEFGLGMAPNMNLRRTTFAK
jgi:hypothetical protein